MDWTLEVVVVPVSDIDRAVEFYRDKLGFHLDHDDFVGEYRIAQLTPPGSGCSIAIGNLPAMLLMEPGTLKGLQLVVPDIEEAHRQLTDRGVAVGDIAVIADRVEATLIHGLSNARVEALNTRIRLLTRIAYGFHSPRPLIALAMLSQGPNRPHLPGRHPQIRQ